MQISSRFFNKALNHTVIHSAVQTTRHAKFGGVGFEQNVIEVNGRPNLHWQHKRTACGHAASMIISQARYPGVREHLTENLSILSTSLHEFPAPWHGVLREYLPWVCGSSGRS